MARWAVYHHNRCQVEVSIWLSILLSIWFLDCLIFHKFNFLIILSTHLKLTNENQVYENPTLLKSTTYFTKLKHLCCFHCKDKIWN